MNDQRIKKIVGREILDSRGNPTVEAEVTLFDGTTARAAAPSGASTGEAEALELRDNDKSRYGGKGTLMAAENISSVIAENIVGLDAEDYEDVDKAMIRADGTDNKGNLGANAVLAASVACIKAAAKSLDVPLYKFIGEKTESDFFTLPVPMMNILNGGAHASNNIDIQEFMIMPVGAESFSDALRQCSEVYHALASVLRKKGMSAAVGDEGGFAPDLAEDEEAVKLILEAVEKAGYQPERDFMIAVDAAASEWKGDSAGEYMLPKSRKKYTSSELAEYWKSLARKYPVISVEDPLDENDWDGWKYITERLGTTAQLVGDDLFVTNTSRISKGVEGLCANSVLIKPNQIGTVSETILAVKTAHRSGYTAIASHRSGETEDAFIADLAVGLGTRQIKTGAPCRSERTAKYNRLLRIEEQLGRMAVYPGMNAFNVRR